MRINTNVSALNAQRLLTQTNEGAARSMAKLSSGFRITRAADDAAGLAIANKFKADVATLKVASRNVSEATSLVQVAEGAATSVHDILVRMKELATQASSANGATQGTVLDNEFTELKNELERIVDGTNYQGTALIDGTFASKTFRIGNSSSTNDELTVSFDGIEGADLGISTMTSVGSLASAEAALGVIDAALTSVNSVLGDLGAYQNRLDYAGRNLATTIQNYSSSESVIRDVDMAAEMTEFSKRQILQQAGTAMLAQANQAAQGVLQLLR